MERDKNYKQSFLIMSFWFSLAPLVKIAFWIFIDKSEGL